MALKMLIKMAFDCKIQNQIRAIYQDFREKVFDFEKKVPSALKFVFGAVAGCGAATAVQPMNLVKNRMQVKFEFPKFTFCLNRAKFYKNRFRAKVEQFDCTRVLGTVQR